MEKISTDWLFKGTLAILLGVIGFFLMQTFATIKSLMQHRTKTINFKTIIMLSAGLGITLSEFVNDESFLPENIDLD